MEKFGVALPDHLAERVEAPLQYGDSRSERIRDLVALSLDIERELATNGWHFDDPEEQHEFVLGIVEDALEEMDD